MITTTSHRRMAVLAFTLLAAGCGSSSSTTDTAGLDATIASATDAAGTLLCSPAQALIDAGAGLAAGDELKKLYARLDPNKETVVYCQSGVRAAETASVLETLGFKNIKVYDSSWLGYAARLDAPAAKERFFNVVALNCRLAAMQRRIDELEKLVADLQTSRAAGAPK